MRNTFKTLLCTMLILGMGISQAAWAGFVPSERAMTSQQTQNDRAEIIEMLDRQEIRAALEEQGVSAEEVEKRISMLPPSKIEQLKTQLNTIPSGEGAVGAVVGALLIVFIILLVTDLIGETDVFDFDD